MNLSTAENLNPAYSLKAFKMQNLQIHSQILRKNPLSDPSDRHNYLLIPKKPGKKFPVIFHLSGYFSTGFQNFDFEMLKKNFVEKVDALTEKKKCPPCFHVFVEANTYWGGSQFINSHGCGSYSDYILKELLPEVLQNYPADKNKLLVMGGSSGGYGALSLISEKNSPFQMAFATAPDSFFEASLLPEIFQAAPELAKYKSLNEVKKAIEKEEIQDKRSFFNLVNVIAMAHCYSPKSAVSKNQIQWPVDLYTGEVQPSIWKQWLKHDPIHFLEKRKAHLKGKKIYLDVGKYDNFSLQFGTRQIFNRLKKQKVKVHYEEFSGNHFGLSARRLQFLEKLSTLWRSS